MRGRELTHTHKEHAKWQRISWGEAFSSGARVKMMQPAKLRDMTGEKLQTSMYFASDTSGSNNNEDTDIYDT